MFTGVWEGDNIPNTGRVLILGESHYGDEVLDKELRTEDVVKTYLDLAYNNEGKRWTKFFDRIAMSFGYKRENASEFYSKVYFGNYINSLCGVKDGKACELLSDTKNRIEYNDSLFQYVNDKDISTVVCFSILSYNSLPKANTDEFEQMINIGKIGTRTDYVREITYHSGIVHEYCNVSLEKKLKVFGVRHPSSSGGYNIQNVYTYYCGLNEFSLLLKGNIHGI